MRHPQVHRTYNHFIFATACDRCRLTGFRVAPIRFPETKQTTPCIQITGLEGRTRDQNRSIANWVTDVVEKEGRAKRENIHVTFVDLPPSSYAEAAITVEDQRNPR